MTTWVYPVSERDRRALAERLPASDTPPPAKPCLVRHQSGGVRYTCTRDKGHKGGHKDMQLDNYWPAEEPKS